MAQIRAFPQPNKLNKHHYILERSKQLAAAVRSDKASVPRGFIPADEAPRGVQISDLTPPIGECRNNLTV